MAKPQEKQPFMTSTSPIMEHDQEGTGVEDGGGCGCFRRFCFGRQRRGDREDNDHLLQGRERHNETTTWLANKLKQAKEASEMVAGPKWKNFIRKLGKLFNRKKKTGQFQYDPYSYALNFDDGDDGEDGYLLGHSSRFGVPVSGDRERRAGL